MHNKRFISVITTGDIRMGGKLTDCLCIKKCALKLTYLLFITYLFFIYYYFITYFYYLLTYLIIII